MAPITRNTGSTGPYTSPKSDSTGSGDKAVKEGMSWLHHPNDQERHSLPLIIDQNPNKYTPSKNKRSMEDRRSFGSARTRNLGDFSSKGLKVPVIELKPFSQDPKFYDSTEGKLHKIPELDYSYVGSSEYSSDLLSSATKYDPEARAREFIEEETNFEIPEIKPGHNHNVVVHNTKNKNQPPSTERKNTENFQPTLENNHHDDNHHSSATYNLMNNTNNKLYGQNLVIFGHIEQRSFIRTIKKCSSFSKVDLFSKYSMNEIAAASDNPSGQLVLYFNMIEVNEANYDIALERIKRILDHFTMTYQGLALFSVLHSREEDETKLMAKSHFQDGELHWKLNDAVMAYCSTDYPRCHIIPDLSTIMKGLNSSYAKDQTFEEYESRKYLKQNCVSGNCRNDGIVLDKFATLSDLSLEKQLEKFGKIFCKVAYHRVVEFTSKLPGQEQFSPEPTTSAPIKSRNHDQVGLVLNDILPLDLKKYDKNQPPRFDGQATIVYFHVTVLSVDSINEESMTYVTDIFLAQSWRDHRLRLPENMTEEYRILDVEWLHRMWRPDCFFKNAKRVTFHKMSVPNHYLWLYHDKTLLYMAKLTLVLSCAMKFEAYPHDTQICSMMIESLSHTTHDLIFKWNETDPLVVNPDIELPQLDISRNNTEDCTLNYSTGNFTCLAVVFNLRRRLGYHLFHTYVPSALTVVMSWISFWIKPEAIPARVTLGVTSLLTLATQNQQSQSSLPPVSYIKAIDVWMSSCTVFVFASLLQFGVVNHFMNAVPISKDLTGYSIDDLSSYDDKKASDEAELTGRSHSRSRSRQRGRSPSVPQYVVTRCSGKDIAIYIDRFSRYFFPLAFLVLNISYWTVYGFL